jgi:hypothetical protein
MVDEFHETDPAQRRLLRLLVGSDAVFVVDPPSAIGRFRGSDPDGVDRYLAEEFSDAHTITLKNNHRGTPEKFAIELKSEAEEAQYIAYAIKRAHLLEGVAYSDMAIILRAHNTTATAIRRALGQSSIPVAGDREAISSNAAIAPFLLLARVAAGIESLSLDVCERLLMAEFGGATSISLRRIRTALLKSRNDAVDTRTGTEMIIDAIEKGDIPIEESAERRTHPSTICSGQSGLKRLTLRIN